MNFDVTQHLWLHASRSLAMMWCHRCERVMYFDYTFGKLNLGFAVYRCEECLTPVQLYYESQSKRWRRT